MSNLPAVQSAILKGLVSSAWAAIKPQQTAVWNPDGSSRSFAALNANANRLARVLRAHGLKAGDAMALVCSNRCEFQEVLQAAQRTGIRLTPINWHLTPTERAFIVADCQAKALIEETRFGAYADGTLPALTLRLSIGEPWEGFLPYASVIQDEDPGDIADAEVGSIMLYTSGTTGRPKGVLRKSALATIPPAPCPYNFETDVQLCVGPAYHGAPLMYNVRLPTYHGLPIVFMDKWDSEAVLRTIESHSITHVHMVPIMFQRLLALPEATRSKYDLSSLKFVLHGAAPCPPEVKRAMIDWFGPIISEYYSGSEGGSFLITSEEWLRKPGSVGRRPAADAAKIFDNDGIECPPYTNGRIFHKLPPGGGFTYFNDPAKTDAGRVGDYFTLGDIGYLDEDDYLFLTGRSAETIISGGVNIYPQEIDNELLLHPAVADSATVGVPNHEWGEEVRAVIHLKPGFVPGDAMAAEILEFVRARLASYKLPRNVDFVTELPRDSAGKIQRSRVRAPYWAGRAREI